MIALDSGFLYALADKGDAWHDRAVANQGTVDEGWVTTWPVLAETCHLLGTRLGSRYVTALLEDLADGLFQVWSPPEGQFARVPELMHKYANLPMDLADATLVLLAEHLGHGRILSTDMRDFGAYRWKNHKPFKNLMETA